MVKRIIASVLIPALLIQVIGCYSESIIDTKSLNNSGNRKIRIITNDGKEYRSKPDYWIAKNDTLVLLGHDISKDESKQQKISFSSIKEVYADQLNTLETILIVSGIVVVVIVVLLVQAAKNQPVINLDGMRWY